MEVNVLESSKDAMIVQIESLTIAELLRVYLNEDSSVTFAAWKREHPTEKPLLSIKGKDVKKSLDNAVNSAVKDLEKVEADFQTLK